MSENKTEFLITARDLTKEAFGSVERGLGKIGGALGSVQTAVLGLVGVGGIGALVKSSMDTSDALAKAADRLGITTQALGGLHYAGDLAGVSAEQLNTSLGKMSKTLVEAAEGGTQANEAFRSLDLSAKELARLPADQAFMRISDALVSVDNNMQRLKLTQDIFGKGATEIINLMAEGSEGMSAARKEAEAFGLALSRVDAAKIEIANDSFTRIKSVFAGIGNTIAVQLSPYIQGIGDWLTKSSVEADGFRSHIQIAMEAAAKSVAFLGDMFRVLHLTWKGLEVAWYGFENTVAVGLDRIVHSVKSLANVLPGINIAPDENLQRWAFDANVGLQKAKFALEQLAEAELPSKGIEEFFANIKQLNAEAAQAIAAKGAGLAGTGEIATAPGIGDKEAEQNAKYEAELSRKLLALSQSLMSAEQLENQNYLNRSLLLEDAWIRDLVTDESYYALSEELALQHQAKLGDIDAQGAIARRKFMQLATVDQTKTVLGELLNMTNGVANSNKTMFKLNQAAGIGNAIINTYEGVSKALAKYPPPLSFIMAGAQLAAGLATVQQIRSATFGGSTSAPSIGGGHAVPVTPATGSDVPAIQYQQPGGNSSQTIQVIINGTILGDEAWVNDVMIPHLQDAINNQDRVLIQPNSRQAAELLVA